MDYEARLTAVWWTCVALAALSSAWIVHVLVRIELNKSMLFDNKLELATDSDDNGSDGGSNGKTDDLRLSAASDGGKLEAEPAVPTDEPHKDDPENSVTPIRRRRVSRSFKIVQVATVSCLVFVNYLLLDMTRAPVWLGTVGMTCVLAVFLRFQIGEELRRNRVDRLMLVLTLFLWIAGLQSLATYASKTYRQGEIYEGPARIVGYDQSSYQNSHNDPVTRTNIEVEFGKWWACPLSGGPVCQAHVQGVLCQAQMDEEQQYNEDYDEEQQYNEDYQGDDGGGGRNRRKRALDRNRHRRKQTQPRRQQQQQQRRSRRRTTTRRRRRQLAADSQSDLQSQNEQLEQQNEQLEQENEELQEELDEMKEQQQEQEEAADETEEVLEDEVDEVLDEEDAIEDEVEEDEMDQEAEIEDEEEASIEEEEETIETWEEEDVDYVESYDSENNVTAAQEEADVEQIEEAYDEYEEEVVEEVEDEYEDMEVEVTDDAYDWQYGDYTTYVYEDDYYEDQYWDYDWDSAWGEYGCEDLFDSDVQGMYHDASQKPGEDDWPTINIYGSCKTCEAYILDYFAKEAFEEVQFYKTQAFLHFAAAAIGAIFTLAFYAKHRVMPTPDNEIELLSSDVASGVLA